MKNSTFLSLLLITLLLFSCTSKKETSPIVGAEAPQFKLKTIDGDFLSLSDFKGKVVLLEFWATWCPPCKASVPEIEAIHEKYIDRDLVVLAISLDEGSDVTERVSAFRDAYKITYPVGIDSDGKISSKYRVASIPTFYLIDKNLKIAKVYTGYLPNMGEKISKDIETLL